MNTLAHRMDTWHDARRAGRLRRPRRVRERRGSPPVPRPADPRARDRFRDERPRDAFVSLEPPDRLVPARRLRALRRARRELRIPLARPAPGAPPRSVRRDPRDRRAGRGRGVLRPPERAPCRAAVQRLPRLAPRALAAGGATAARDARRARAVPRG